MAKLAAILGVHLLGPDAQVTRVGTLSRDTLGSTAIEVDEAYLRDAWQIARTCQRRGVMKLSGTAV